MCADIEVCVCVLVGIGFLWCLCVLTLDLCDFVFLMQVVRENEARRIRKMIAKPSFVRHSIFENGVVGIELRRLTVELCKPIYVGMSVLDLSKLLMYDFLYNNLKVRAGWF